MFYVFHHLESVEKVDFTIAMFCLSMIVSLFANCHVKLGVLSAS